MLIDMVAMHVMKMTIMEIIDMAFVANCGVAAAGPMDVIVIGVDVAAHC